MIAGELCPLCSSRGLQIGEKDGIPLRLCCHCNILLAWAWPDESAYERQYSDPEDYHVREQIANGQKPFAERDKEHCTAACARLHTLESLYPLPGRTLVDVGAGTGAFVDMASQYHGVKAHGFEPCGTLVASARKAGRDMHVGGWQDVAGEVDFITLFDVFEHITRPHEALDHFYQHLANDSRLVIEMPEWDSPQMNASGLGWKHIRPRQHVALYSDSAFRDLLARHGFVLDAFYRPVSGSLGKATWVARKAGR